MPKNMITANFRKPFDVYSSQIVSIFHSHLCIIFHFIFKRFKQHMFYYCNE